MKRQKKPLQLPEDADHIHLDRVTRPTRRPRTDLEERLEFDEWQEDRGRRGRKPRGKAGGRREKGRQIPD